MELAYELLTDEQLQNGLSGLNGWSVQGDKLTKEFSFKSYKDGLVFASTVGFLADNLDHHPDIEIGYQKVRIAMNTHAVNGLSPYDLELAKRIENVL